MFNPANWIRTFGNLSASELMVILTFGFLTASVIMIVDVYSNRTWKLFRKRKDGALRLKLQKILNTIIVNQAYSIRGKKVPSFEFWCGTLADLIRHSNHAKHVLIDELISVKRNIMGDSADALSAVYCNLGLYHCSLEKIESRRWYVQVQGARELAEMEYRPAIPKILSLTTSKNQLVQEESMVALLKLEQNNPLFFFENFTGSLSLRMQINMCYHFQSYDFRRLPDFTKWFWHPSQSVRLFSVKMTLVFKQVSAIHELMMLLSAEDLKVKALAVKALAELQAIEALDAIVALANKGIADQRLAKEVLKAIRQLGSDRHTSTVNKYIRHSSYSVRFEAVRTLKLLGVCHYAERENVDTNRILLHLSDPLLR